MKATTPNTTDTNNKHPDAKPSKPSVKLTALEEPVTIKEKKKNKIIRDHPENTKKLPLEKGSEI